MKLQIASAFGLGLWLAAAASPAQVPLPDAQFYFDARSKSFHPEENRMVLQGEVVAIGVGALIAADEIEYDQKRNVMNARGHIVVLSRDQVFTGESLTYLVDSGDFRITDAVMVANDPATVARVTDELLGFNAREAAYEAERKKRLDEVQVEKRLLQQEARRQLRLGQDIDKDLIDRYARALEQERLIKNQENPALARLDSERRERLKARRSYWEKSRKAAGVLKRQSGVSKTYFRMDGEELTRTNGNDFEAREALWTPCRCEEDEAPAWAFSADRAEAQIGGYADLYHPVLRIKGIPVLYLPYLKIPIKDERQSGFLPPTFSFDDRSGNIYSQPVFFAFSPSSDATLTTDVFERRGTRLGLEYRHQQREYSGWEFSVEGMRDSLWMEDRSLRQLMRDLYRDGLRVANDRLKRGQDRFTGRVEEQDPDLSPRAYAERVLQDPDFWSSNYSGLRRGNEFDPEVYERTKSSIDEALAVPDNAWRSSYSWRGVTFLAPRLSLVSRGDIVSDHRYIEELKVPDDLDVAFLNGREARAVSPSAAALHLDGKDFYAGLSTHFGDNFRADDQFEGTQIPTRLKLQSRYLSLLPDDSPVPVYAQLQGEALRLSEFRGDEAAEDRVSLGDGDWRRLKVDASAPLLSDSIVQVTHYAEAESRYIEHAGLSDPRSEIRSFRTGLDFTLPIDGKGPMPEIFRNEEDESEDSDNLLIHHLMKWRLGISTRPVVVRNGPYGDDFLETETGASLGRLTYFSSDGKLWVDDDNEVPAEARMDRHRILRLSTSHDWKIERRRWQRVAGKKPASRRESEMPEQTEGEETVEEAEKPLRPDERSLYDIAREELLYSLGSPITDPDQVVDEATGEFLVDRYLRQDETIATPVHFDASIGFDFLKEEARRKQRERSRELGPELDSLIAESDREIARLEEELAQDPDDATRASLNRQLKEARARRAKQVSERQALDDLPQSWIGPIANLRLSAAGFTLNNHVNYNVYRHNYSKLDFRLSFPTFFSTRLSATYTVQREFTDIDSYQETKTRGVVLNTGLIPHVTNSINVQRRAVEGADVDYTDSYRIAYQLTYLSPSDCWGLTFQRVKDYGEEERQAEYVLRLSVIFLGHPRSLPNMSPGLTREIRDEEG